jgi:glucose-1-phosphate cytidylyltransferase
MAGPDPAIYAPAIEPHRARSNGEDGRVKPDHDGCAIMKAVILAGGLGTRIAEESHLRPKPMIEIGGHPLLWHVMNIYTVHGVTEFVICLGYRGHMIKEYFANYMLHSSDVTIDARSGEIAYHRNYAEPWRITLVDTGADTMTGGRLKRVARYLDRGDSFCMTYGDGVANIDITSLIHFHRCHGRLATVTAVTPPGRYGSLLLDQDVVHSFTEKPPGDNAVINGGFFVLHPAVLDRIEGDETPWETEPLESLARDGELRAFRHPGFWQAMDTLRDKTTLETLWSSGAAPWKMWRD